MRFLRASKGFTQKKFASILNLSPQRYNYYETGRNEPEYQTLVKIADILETTTDYLLCRTDKDNSLKEPINDDKKIKGYKNELPKDEKLIEIVHSDPALKYITPELEQLLIREINSYLTKHNVDISNPSSRADEDKQKSTD